MVSNPCTINKDLVPTITKLTWKFLFGQNLLLGKSFIEQYFLQHKKLCQPKHFITSTGSAWYDNYNIINTFFEHGQFI